MCDSLSSKHAIQGQGDLKPLSGREGYRMRAKFDGLTALAAEAEEDAADVAAYDAAKAEFEANGSIAFPPELSALLLKHENRLAAARTWRGISQVDLAAKAEIGQGFLSDLETGLRRGATATMERLAAALDAPWIGSAERRCFEPRTGDVGGHQLFENRNPPGD